MNHFNSDIRIIPSFSSNLLIILFVLSMIAIATVISLSLNILIKLIVITGIIVWFLITVREHCSHSGLAISEARLKKDGTWLLLLNNSNKDKAIKSELLSGCLVQPWLTVLQFKLPDRRKKSLVLLRDNLDLDTFRRLRVRLTKQGV